MTGWTTIWVVVITGLVGVAPQKTEALDLGVCQSSCSAVPQDLWPYCCETHHTCCGQFADSCLHDCLPRVSSGDVSVVEERPGLCCALYNLCCFRETPRISSGKSDDFMKPQSFPITHRFSTLPGGPVRRTQSAVTPEREAYEEEPIQSTFTKPKVETTNRKPSTPNRPRPSRPQSSSFRDNARSSNQEDKRTGAFSSQPVDTKVGNHRFDIRDQAPVRPTVSETPKPEPKEDAKELNRPQLSPRRPTLRKLVRPQPVEAKDPEKTETDPIEGRPNKNTPKNLERPEPRKFVRPGLVSRPTNQRQLEKQESVPVETDKQNIAIEERKTSNPTSPRRPLPFRPPSQAKLIEQPTEEETVETESRQKDRINKSPRIGSLIRLGGTKKDAKPEVETTEKPEPEIAPEQNRPRALKLLKPNIRPLRPGSSNPSAGETTPTKTKNLDQVSADSNVAEQSLKDDETDSSLRTENNPRKTAERPNIFRQGRLQKLVPSREEKNTADTVTPVTEPQKEGTASPIRKVKRIRTRGPGKRVLSQNTEVQTQEPDTSKSPKVKEDTTESSVVRSQASRGRPRSRSRSSVTNTQPQPIQAQSRGTTSTNRSRSRTTTNIETTRKSSNANANAQETSDNTTRQRSSTGSRFRSRGQSTTQEASRGHTQVTRGRSRSRSQPAPSLPVDQVPTASENELFMKKTTDRPLNIPKVEETAKEVTEILTITEKPKEDKMMKEIEEIIKTIESAQIPPKIMKDKESQSVVNSPLEPREQPVDQPKIKKTPLFKLQAPIVGTDSVQQQKQEQVTSEPEPVFPLEEDLKSDQSAYLPSAPEKEDTKSGQLAYLPSAQEKEDTKSDQSAYLPAAPQKDPRIEPEQLAARELPEPRVTLKAQPSRGRSSVPEVRQPSSQTQRGTRQRSEPQQATRQRSSAQPSAQSSAPASRSSTSRSSRGRLTARQRAALEQSGSQ